MNEETVRPRITTAELQSEIEGLLTDDVTDDERLSVRGQALLDLRDERFDGQKLQTKLLRIVRERDNACRSSHDMAKAYLRLQSVILELQECLSKRADTFFVRVANALTMILVALEKEGGKIAS